MFRTRKDFDQEVIDFGEALWGKELKQEKEFMLKRESAVVQKIVDDFPENVEQLFWLEIKGLANLVRAF